MSFHQLRSPRVQNVLSNPPLATGLTIKTGTYLGNGSTQSITALGVAPHVVMIKGDSNTLMQVKTDAMAGNLSIPLNGAASSTTAITSLDTTGFTVGSDGNVNTAGVAYYYTIIGDPSGSFLKTGSYTGTAATQAITGFGFQPDMVSVHSINTDGAAFATSAMTAGHATGYHANGDTTGLISSLDSDGFTLGASTIGNASASTYYYWALKANALLKPINYAGNGLATKSITGAGFSGDMVMIKDLTTGSNTAVTASTVMPVGGSMNTSAHNIAFNTSQFQSFDTDGYTVKNSVDVNNGADSYASYVLDVGSLTGTVSSGAVNASISQLAATVTAAGGTQVIATVNIVAISQAAATVTATGGTQTVVAHINASVAQVAATITASGGTQAIATVNNVSIAQLAATVTASGGTQTVVSVSFAAIAQVAATITATGGTQTVATVNKVAIAQLAATVTATGGTQSVSAVSNVSIAQVAATITAAGGTQVVSASGIVNASIAQVAATVTASGGTQVVASVQIASIAQLAATITASGGTQVVTAIRNVSIAQLAAIVTATGGTQALSAVQNAALAQIAAILTATGGLQSITTIIPVNWAVSPIVITSQTTNLVDESSVINQSLNSNATIESLDSDDNMATVQGQKTNMTLQSDTNEKTL